MGAGWVPRSGSWHVSQMSINGGMSNGTKDCILQVPLEFELPAEGQGYRCKDREDDNRLPCGFPRVPPPGLV
jgi:hypothetical protein